MTAGIHGACLATRQSRRCVSPPARGRRARGGSVAAARRPARSGARSLEPPSSGGVPGALCDEPGGVRRRGAPGVGAARGRSLLWAGHGRLLRRLAVLPCGPRLHRPVRHPRRPGRGRHARRQTGADPRWRQRLSRCSVSAARAPARRPPSRGAEMRHALRLLLFVPLAARLAAPALAAAPVPAPQEGSCSFHDFRFDSGETLPELRLHYTTLGAPAKDAAGGVRNAVLILHGTSGDGKGFLREQFAGQLFGPGQLLDASRFYIILPDGIGHGKSSRPSDGLRMRFPKYGYGDMVRAQHRLLTDCLGVDHLRLVMGTSMGGMHTWVWGYTYPGFMDALMPLASLPVEIA